MFGNFILISLFLVCNDWEPGILGVGLGRESVPPTVALQDNAGRTNYFCQNQLTGLLALIEWYLLCLSGRWDSNPCSCVCIRGLSIELLTHHDHLKDIEWNFPFSRVWPAAWPHRLVLPRYTGRLRLAFFYALKFKGSVSRDFRPLFFSWFEPIWVLD